MEAINKYSGGEGGNQLVCTDGSERGVSHRKGLLEERGEGAGKVNSRGNHSGIRGKMVTEGNKEGMTDKVEVTVNVAQRANGSMDKYVKATWLTIGETKCRDSKDGKDTKLVGMAMIDPKKPRKKPNRRTRRKLLQLYKVQSKPTLNWFGF